MILTVPALLVACSLHADQPLVLAVAQAFSAGNPYMTRQVRLDVLARQDEPLSRVAATSESAARRAITRILQAGGEPVLGLLPARPNWALDLERSPAELLQPCENIAISTAYLSRFDWKCREKGAEPSSAARRRCTLSLYGRALGLHALPQVVLAALRNPSPTLMTARLAVSDAVLKARNGGAK